MDYEITEGNGDYDYSGSAAEVGGVRSYNIRVETHGKFPQEEWRGHVGCLKPSAFPVVAMAILLFPALALALVFRVADLYGWLVEQVAGYSKGR